MDVSNDANISNLSDIGDISLFRISLTPLLLDVSPTLETSLIVEA